MIKIEHVGMFDRAVVNPMLTAQTATANYTIINDANGDAYLVINKFEGDNAYRDRMVIPAGEFLNGYLLKSLKGQNLVIEGKHIDGGIESAEVGDTLIVNEDGVFEIGEATGKNLYLVITDVDARLAEKAVKAKIVVAPVAEEGNGGGSNADPVVNTISPTTATFDMNTSGVNYGDKVFTVTPAASGATIDKLLDDEGDETPSEYQGTTLWSVGASGLVLTLTKEYLSVIGAAVISAGGTQDMTIKLTDDSTVAITITFEDTT